MNVLLAGASGLIGRKLAEHLESRGHQMSLLRRPAQRSDRSHSPDPRDPRVWDPAAGLLDPRALQHIEAVICLSGENIGEGRWSAAKKRRIVSSRIDSVGLLARTIAQLESRPKVFITASAVGYYGDSGSEWCGEAAPPGNDFLSRLCVDWEQAADPARECGVRVVHLRFGAVLDPQGGLLGKLLTPFRLGLGGVVGNGRQYLSWVSAADAAAITVFALENPAVSGPVNACSPNPVTNREFTKTLGKILGRPTVLPIPALAIRLALGEQGQALALSSIRARPEVLERLGYRFEHPALEDALRFALQE